MSKYINDVEKARKYIAGGMEQGPGPAVDLMPSMLARINELERALVPFAIIGQRDNQGLPLTQVYHKDCVEATRVMSPKTK